MFFSKNSSKASRIVIAASGDAKSMNLIANTILKQNKEVIVAYISYSFIPNSKDREKVVKEFCTQNTIELYIKKMDYPKISVANRKFFIEKERNRYLLDLAKEKQADTIYFANTMDHWIVEAIEKHGLSEDYLYFGLKKRIYVEGIFIENPMLKQYEEDIVKENNKKNIPFIFEEKDLRKMYDKSKLRVNLLTMTTKQRLRIFKDFSGVNTSKSKLRKSCEDLYFDWKDKNFNLDIYRDFRDKYKKPILLMYFSKLNNYLKIDDNIINNIMTFISNHIQNNTGGNYPLNKNTIIILSGKKISIRYT